MLYSVVILIVALCNAMLCCLMILYFVVVFYITCYLIFSVMQWSVLCRVVVVIYSVETPSWHVNVLSNRYQLEGTEVDIAISNTLTI